jgi:16S rRNA (guanine527-N7)-methyltransferase
MTEAMFHVKHEGWTFEHLSSAQEEALERYEVLLRDRGVPLGLVATSDAKRVWERHIADSLRAVPLVPMEALLACDLGSGGGLPGIPISIALPRLRVTLVEARRLRAAFLELVVDELGLANATVFPGRIETLEGPFDVALARGFAAPAPAWAVAEALLAPEGRLLYWAGAAFRSSAGPDGVRVEIAEGPTLESGGPIVIMTRQ